MKNWFKRGLVLVVGLGAVIGFEHWYFRETLEGIVLRVDDGERVLLAQNLDLNEDDFKKSYVEWFLGDYELIEITNVEGVESGMRLSVTFDGRTLSENALTVSALDYEVLDVAFSVVDSAVPASIQSTVEQNGELARIFPVEVGLLQVFGGRDSYAFVQRLNHVEEVSGALQLYFEGHANTGTADSRGFNLMYQVEGDSIVEYVRNFDEGSYFGDGVLLHSIIERKTVLQSPLEVGNSWSETFSFEGRLHEATTTIVRVEENGDGNLEIETATVVEGIEGFPDERYEEERVFVEGSGLTRFQNSPRLGENTIFTYGFSLVTEKMD